MESRLQGGGGKGRTVAADHLADSREDGAGRPGGGRAAVKSWSERGPRGWMGGPEGVPAAGVAGAGAPRQVAWWPEAQKPGRGCWLLLRGRWGPRAGHCRPSPCREAAAKPRDRSQNLAEGPVASAGPLPRAQRPPGLCLSVRVCRPPRAATRLGGGSTLGSSPAQVARERGLSPSSWAKPGPHPGLRPCRGPCGHCPLPPHSLRPSEDRRPQCPPAASPGGCDLGQREGPAR